MLLIFLHTVDQDLAMLLLVCTLILIENVVFGDASNSGPLDRVIHDQDIHVSPQCNASLQRVLSASGREEWARIMFSSLEPGALDIRSRRLVDFGDFDACIQIREAGVHGKYCLFRHHFNWSDPSSQVVPFSHRQFFKLETMAGSVCLPATCSDQEILVIVQKYLALEGTRTEIRAGCETMDRIRDPETWDEESMFRKILIAWIAILLSATLLSVRINSRFLKCFSIVRNTQLVFQEERKSPYDFLYGFRYYFLIVACWLHIFNMFIFFSPLALMNFVNYRTTLSPGVKIVFCNFSHAMGANLVWSGELSYCSYLSNIVSTGTGMLGFSGRLEELKRNHRFNLTKSFISRILRMMPLTFGCYLLILAFPRSLISGPIFRESFSGIRHKCLTKYMNDLSFRQNEVPISETCIGPSWILAPDMQLFAASFPLIYVYHKNARTGKILIACLILVSCIAQAVYIHVNQYPAFFQTENYNFKYKKDNIGLHVSTVNYVSSYLVGMMAIILMTEFSQPKSLIAKSVLTIAPVACFWVSWYIPYRWTFQDHVSRIEELAYGATYRTVVAVGLSIAAFNQSRFLKSCLITKFMSNRIFVTLGKFNFSTYMGHFLFLYYDLFSTRKAVQFNTYEFIRRGSYVSNMGILIGFLLHLLFEAPFQKLSLFLLSRRSSRRGSSLMQRKSSI